MNFHLSTDLANDIIAERHRAADRRRLIRRAEQGNAAATHSSGTATRSLPFGGPRWRRTPASDQR